MRIKLLLKLGIIPLDPKTYVGILVYMGKRKCMYPQDMFLHSVLKRYVYHRKCIFDNNNKQNHIAYPIRTLMDQNILYIILLCVEECMRGCICICKL